VTDFHVEPQALEQFAAASQGRLHDADDLLARMRAVHVPRDSFGYLPGIGGRVYDDYDEFVHGCADSLSSAAAAMGSIASAVRDVVTAYTTSDQAARDSAVAVQTDLSTVDIRGPR
jgi:hypothetical protein